MSDDWDRWGDSYLNGGCGSKMTDEETDEFLRECEGMTKEQWKDYKAWCAGNGQKEFKYIDEEGRQIIYN
mgnify:CR=1 FL=1